MPDRLAWSLPITLAIALRVAAIAALQSHTVPRSTYEHGEIAANLVQGRGFSVKFLGADGPTSQQAPLYPALVASAYAIGGIDTPRSLLIVQLVQAAMGGLIAAGVMALVREIAPDRPGMGRIAGWIAALHPTLIYAATHIQVATLAATLLVWTLALAYRTGRGRGDLAAIATGLMLALLILTDPILGLCLPGIFWAVAMGRGWRSSLRPSAILVLTAILGISPWIARNARVHGEFVFIKSTFGYAFWQGNCKLSEGTDKVVRPSVELALNGRESGLKGMNEALWKARHEAGYLDDIALTRDDYRKLARLTEPERSRVLFRKALDDLRSDPRRYPELCLRRLRYFLLFDETNPKTRSPIYRAGHAGLTLLAVLGLCLMPGHLRRRFGPTLLTAGLIAIFHAMTIVSARFHVPIEPLMAAWAAGIVSRWTMGLTRSRDALHPRRENSSS